MTTSDSTFGRNLARLAAVALLIGLAAPPARAEKIVLKYSSIAPAPSWVNRNLLQPYIERINRDAAGLMEIRFFPGSVLGKANRQFEIVTTGVADFATIVTPYKPQRFKRSKVVELPFSYRNTREASLAIWRMIERGDFGEEFAAVRLVGLWVTSPLLLHTTFAVRKVEHLRGRRIRMAGRYQAATLRRLGAVGVALPVTQVVEAIRKGVVDGTLNDWKGGNAFGIVDATAFHTVAPLGGILVIIAMNKEAYRRLPAPAKAVIDRHSGRDYVAWMARRNLRAETEAIGRAEKAGRTTVIRLAAKETERWRKLLAPVERQFVQDTPDGAAILARFKAERDRIRNEP